MAELMLVFGLIAGVAGLAGLAMLSVNVLLWLAGILFVLGFVVGVGAGVIYHIKLYQVLTPRGELSEGWLWKPYRDHDKLREDERGRILIWWYLGGLGFMGVVGSGLVGGVAAIRLFLTASSMG